MTRAHPGVCRHPEIDPILAKLQSASTQTTVRISYESLPALLDHYARRSGPSEHYVSEVGLGPAPWWRDAVEPVPEGIEQVPRIVLGGWLLSDRHIVSETVRADVATGCPVNDEITPQSHHVIFVIPVASVFQGEADFSTSMIRMLLARMVTSLSMCCVNEHPANLRPPGGPPESVPACRHARFPVSEPTIDFGIWVARR